MGSGSSVQTDAKAEAQKDLEAGDITTLEEGIEEVKRLRALLSLHGELAYRISPRYRRPVRS